MWCKINTMEYLSFWCLSCLSPNVLILLSEDCALSQSQSDTSNPAGYLLSTLWYFANNFCFLDGNRFSFLSVMRTPTADDADRCGYSSWHPSQNNIYHCFEEEEYIENFIWENMNVLGFLPARKPKICCVK